MHCWPCIVPSDFFSKLLSQNFVLSIPYAPLAAKHILFDAQAIIEIDTLFESINFHISLSLPTTSTSISALQYSTHNPKRQETHPT